MESGSRENRQKVDTSELIILNELIIDKLQNYIKENIQSEESNKILKAQEFLGSFIEAREKIKNKEIQPKGYRTALNKLNEQMKTTDVDFIDTNLLLKEAQDIAAKAAAQVKRYQDKGHNLLAQINDSLTDSQKGKIYTVAAAYFNMAMRTNKISADDRISSQKFFDMASNEAKRNGVDALKDPDFHERIRKFLLRNEVENELKNELKPSPSDDNPTYLPFNVVREGKVGHDLPARDALARILFNNILIDYRNLKGDTETLPMLKLGKNLNPINTKLLEHYYDGLDLNGIVKTIRDHIQDAEDSVFITAQDKEKLQTLNKAIDRFVSSYNKAVDDYYVTQRKVARIKAPENPVANKSVGRAPAALPQEATRVPLTFSPNRGEPPVPQAMPTGVSQSQSSLFSHPQKPMIVSEAENKQVQILIDESLEFIKIHKDRVNTKNMGDWYRGAEILETLQKNFEKLKENPSFESVSKLLLDTATKINGLPQEHILTTLKGDLEKAKSTPSLPPRNRSKS
jgi:hypothetical protein